MRIRCVKRPFVDLVENRWREVGDEWEASAERLADINSAGYGIMAEAVQEEPEPAHETPDLTRMTRAQLLDKAAGRGVEVPARATKADIIEALEG